MRTPLKVEVVAYAPTVFFQCRHCEVVYREAGIGQGLREEQIHSGLPPDLLREYTEVSDWVGRLRAAHGERIAVDVIDVASVRGFWKSLRHRIRRYPAVIVGGRVRFAASELGLAAGAVERLLPAA
jgi:hypothetical protein